MDKQKLIEKIRLDSNKTIEYNPHSELKITVRKIPKELIDDHLRNHEPTLIEEQEYEEEKRYKLYYEYDKTKDLIVVISFSSEGLKIITSFYQYKLRRLKNEPS